MEKKINKEHYESLINDYVDGKARIQGDHPEDVHKAIDSFFYAGKMLVDHPEIGTVITECFEHLEDEKHIFGSRSIVSLTIRCVLHHPLCPSTPVVSFTTRCVLNHPLRP